MSRQPQNICVRCGLLRPELFMVPDHVWRHYIERRQRLRIVCFGCWRERIGLVDRGEYAAKHGAEDDGRYTGLYRAEGVWWVFGPPDTDLIGPRQAAVAS